MAKKKKSAISKCATTLGRRGGKATAAKKRATKRKKATRKRK